MVQAHPAGPLDRPAAPVAVTLYMAEEEPAEDGVIAATVMGPDVRGTCWLRWVVKSAMAPGGPWGPVTPCGPRGPRDPRSPCGPWGPRDPCGPLAFQDSSVDPVLQPAVFVV